MLKMINGEDDVINVESVINIPLLLTNLHGALNHFEQFRVVYTPEELSYTPDDPEFVQNLEVGMMHICLIPAEGETSLQRYTEEGESTLYDPFTTFGELQKDIWPEINAIEEPNEDQGQKLIFYIGGKEQDFNFSLYQALLCHFWRDDNDFHIYQKLWNPDLGGHIITYRRITTNSEKFVESFADMENQSRIILQFVRKIHDLGIGCSVAAFVNNGLDEKLEEQMEDCYGGESPIYLPPWWIHLMLSYPFLFSYQNRCKFFKMAAYWDRNFSGSMADENSFANEVTLIVSRNNILDDAKRLMDQHASNYIELSVKFVDELGIGMGPTSEFYTLVSKEFQKCDLMWRKDISVGLFPCPRLASSIEEVKTKFVLLGQIVGKVIQTGRLLDIHFSKAFYKLILGKELSIYDIQSFEPDLGRILLEFKELVRRKKLTESDLRYKDGSIEDLCLSFVVPGYEDFTSGYKDDVTVDSMNLEDYISFVKDATVGSGVLGQVEAFIEGFNQ
ncbi:E3 ubiquitin-protein ligase UPL4-like, partial [Trifolium medium]|nr:E3 ubiquitin-protein ligase UPL4-like [Trifolium medium]